MLLGTWGCAIDSIGVIVKYFLPNPEHLWPLYTLFLLGGWTIYAPAQLLVLYSRLHLINQNHKLQRWLLILIIAVSSLMIIPTWPMVWQAFNPYKPRLSALYSPREAIVDRYTQLGFTVTEIILDGIYIWSLAKLLNLKSSILKSSVRPRRVMTDLIYVNVIAVCLDILTVVLVFLNQTGISHPIQAFSYILKLKLEFMVLNQIMAVAARGFQKYTFAERRYHYPSKRSAKADSDKALVISWPTVSTVQGTPNDSGPESMHDYAHDRRRPMGMTVTERGVRKGGDDADEDEDEEIGIHMWERRGNLVMEVPWFRAEAHA